MPMLTNRKPTDKHPADAGPDLPVHADGIVPYREHRFAAYDGLEIYYRSYGDPENAATPVLCLAGLARNSKDFHDLAMHLAPKRRIFCLDYRGRGRSDYDPNWHNYRPETYVADIGAFFIHAGLSRAVFIGTSLGGLLGQAIGALMPALMAGLVINDIGPEVNPTGLDRIVAKYGRDLRFPDYESAARAERETYGHVYPDEDDDFWMKVTRDTFIDDGEGGLKLDYDLKIGDALRETASQQENNMWPLFEALTPIPVLAIRGALSDTLSEEVFDRMAEVKPDLQRLTLANRGHTPMLTEPASLDAIDAFLATIP